MLFTPVHTGAFSYENGDFFVAFSPIVHFKTTEKADRRTVMVYDDFLVTVSKRLRFHLSTLRIETDLFQNFAFSKRSTKVQSRFRKPPFSSAFSRALVWMIGENASKLMRFQTKTHLCG